MISLFGFIFLCISIIAKFFLILSVIIKTIELQLNKFILITKVSAFFVFLSFFSLMLAYVTSDFSNYNVFQNSHSLKPLIYKITGTWGNHEGSMMLWLCIIALYNLLFSIRKTSNEKFKKGTIFVQSIIFIFFALFVIFVSNPFLVNSIKVEEGLGLNPILQDPALAIHPPLLYAGYVGYSLIFSLAIAGLYYDNINEEWIYIVKKWSLLCWSLLTAGIGLGAYWAYYELGWGGWWFWDPVENLSLMPWITGLALTHSLLINNKDQILKKWIVFLAILCFSLSIFGTFLVRSGVLTSVHSFASDPSRGIFILLIFFLISGFGFILFFLKISPSEKPLELLFINKTTALVFNNLLMIIACLTILLGTIYPIVIEVITNSRISVGGPYFNSTVLPIMLPGFLLMSIAPILSWQSNRIKKTKNYLVAFIFLIILIVIFSLFTTFNPWAIIGIFLGLWIITASMIAIFINYKVSLSFKFIKNINSFIAHIGVGILILGITVSSIYKIEKNYEIAKEETFKISDINIYFKDVVLKDKKNYQELRGIFSIDNHNKIKIIEAGKNYYFVSKTITTEAGILHTWFRDIYIVLGDQNDKLWNIKVYINPLVNFIWLGVFIMIISGIVGVIKK